LKDSAGKEFAQEETGFAGVSAILSLCKYKRQIYYVFRLITTS
jgi:hypothetical protein